MANSFIFPVNYQTDGFCKESGVQVSGAGMPVENNLKPLFDKLFTL
jgi:hypothetical protein